MKEFTKLNSFKDLDKTKFNSLAAPKFTSNKTKPGKVATIIKGYKGNSHEIRGLAKELKKKLSVGGTVKDNEIIIQGNYREKIISILSGMGYKLKRVGG